MSKCNKKLIFSELGTVCDTFFKQDKNQQQSQKHRTRGQRVFFRVRTYFKNKNIWILNLECFNLSHEEENFSSSNGVRDVRGCIGICPNEAGGGKQRVWR